MLFTTTTPSGVMMKLAFPARLNCGSPSGSRTFWDPDENVGLHFAYFVEPASGRMAVSKGQKAEGRKQKAEGRYQVPGVGCQRLKAGREKT